MRKPLQLNRSRLLNMAFWMLAAAGVVLLGWGCAPETRYRTLTFFFDGVPDPNAAKDDAAAGTGKPDGTGENRPKRARPTPTIHKPFRGMQCIKCHIKGARVSRDNRFGLKKKVADGLCHDCHKEFKEEAKYLHAPIRVYACQECHHHHRAPNRALQIKPTNVLCGRCHELDDLSPKDHRNDEEALNAECTKCHNPHRGNDRYFLKSKFPPKKAATAPKAGGS